MALTDTEQERVWFAREVMSLFVKCFTNLKLYPHEHVHCKTSLDEFSKRLRSYVHLHDLLRIGVNQETLTLDEQPVYEAASRNENLAFRLYVDGLRELSIKRGVTHAEAERLAFVFYKAVADPVADATVLLWEADFTNVEYLAINSLSEAWESPDYFSSDQLGLLDEMNRDVGRIVESLQHEQGRDAYSFELTDGAAELEQSADLGLADAARDDAEGDIYRLDEAALGELQKDVQAWGPDRLLKAVVEHSLDGLALAPEAIGVENVAWLLQEALELAMRSKDLDMLGELLVRYDGEQGLTEEDAAEALFQKVFAWLGREENLGRLVGMAKGGALGGPKAFCRILALMGAPGLLAAISTFIETENKELADALLGFMVENAHLNPPAFAALLRPDIGIETVKAGLFVINKRVRGEELSALLKIAREHPDAEVREYADHLWRANTEDGRVAAQLEALGAESRADRVRALQALVQGKRREALPRLKEVIGGQAFVQRDSHERRAYLDALAFLGGTTAVAFLEQQMQRSTMLFNRKAVKELREEAREALASLRDARPKGGAAGAKPGA